MALEGIVLLPKSVLALNIFEPRYKDLLSSGLKNDRTFAVCHVQDGRPASCFGLGLIKSSMQNSDGTYFLMLEGIERYRIKEVLSVDPVLRVLCQKMEVPAVDAAGQYEDLRRHKHKRKRLESLLTQMGDRFPQFISQVNDIKKSDLSHSDFCDTVGGVFVGDVRLRQKLLQTVSVEKRLTLLCEFLDTGLLN